MIPEDVRNQLGNVSTYPEVAEIRLLLGSFGWESVDQDELINAINRGVAVISLCDSTSFAYFVPLFMELSITYGFCSGQDEMFIESFVHRVRAELSDGNSALREYSESQRDVLHEFLVLCQVSFVESDDMPGGL